MESVLSLNYPSFEVHLVDNHSSNAEGATLENTFRDRSNVFVHLNNSNLGFSQANIQIVEQLLDSDFEFIALLNNDTTVDSGWLLELVKEAEQNGSDMVSSKLINYYDRNIMDNAGHQMLTTGEIVPIGHRDSVAGFDSRCENFGSCAAATLYRTSMIRRIGFFDDYFTTGYEDAEYGMRANVLGYQCVYNPTAIAYHKIGQSISKVYDVEYAQMIQSSIWYSYFKVMPSLVIVLTLPFIILKVLLLMLFNLVSGRTKYQSILRASIKDTANNWSKIKCARRTLFSSSEKTRSVIDIIRRQTFFLPYDIRRFYRVFIRGNESSYDEYARP